MTLPHVNHALTSRTQTKLCSKCSICHPKWLLLRHQAMLFDMWGILGIILVDIFVLTLRRHSTCRFHVDEDLLLSSLAKKNSPPQSLWKKAGARLQLISNTDKQSMFVVVGWFRTPKLWKHRWLWLLESGILKTVLHHADCPSAHLAMSPLLRVREDFGSQWN